MSLETDSPRPVIDGRILIASAARLKLTMAVVTRHGSEVHLWNPNALRSSRTFCGLEYIDIAPDASPATVTCSRCAAPILFGLLAMIAAARDESV